MEKTVEVVDSVAIRFAGDSGDGMQVTGAQFANTTALAGNDLSTFPDYPAEIRAPTGTLAGVSGFQIAFASTPVFTPGDHPDVLVAMNPAALKVNLPDLMPGALVIANSEQFTENNLERAGYSSNPLEDDSLSAYRVYSVDITGMTLDAVADLKLNPRVAARCKNFFALGLVYWLYSRDTSHTLNWIKNKFKDPKIVEANVRALTNGYNFGETAELFEHNYEIKPGKTIDGLYRNLGGNEAIALGFVAAAKRSGLDLFLGSYPITPATEILQFLSTYADMGVKTLQVEDEIAAICVAIGGAYAGKLAVTTTSGPGLALKSEALGLAHMFELPLVIVNVQRGGPSTGLPTKTEQSDLMQSMFGRNGDAPVPVVAARSAADAFDAAVEACRIAVRHMTPVMLLSDGFIANSSEAWRVPDMKDLPEFPVAFRTDPNGYQPYMRDENLARPWVIPGTPDMEHRIGGLEKEHLTGAISYDSENHAFMTQLRADKVAKIADYYEPLVVEGDATGDVLVVGWGSTYGAIRGGVERMRAAGYKVGHAHLRNVFPFPKELGDVLSRYKKVVVPELNNGQLVKLIRAEYLVDAQALTKVQGKPFKEIEIFEALKAQLETH